jgi:ribosomal protein S25
LGGTKKKTVSQMKREEEKRRERDAEKKKAKQVMEKKERSAFFSEAVESTLKELSKLDVLTPYTVASQLNLRLSAAKKLLKELEFKKLIQMVQGNTRIKIYKLASPLTPS